MKKFLGVLVAVMLCVCAMIPVAGAADLDLSALTGALEGVDLSNLSAGEIANVLGVDVGSLDSVLSELQSATDTDNISSILSSLSLDSASASTGSDSSAASSSSLLDGIDLSAITSLFDGFDISSITDSLGSGDALSSITDMFSGADASSFDLSSLTDMISGAFGDSGFDISSLTEGIDLGSFDISSVLGGLGGGDSSSGGLDAAEGGISGTISGLADKIKDGLSSLGLDTSFIDGLGDSDIVNFFTNLYMGIGQTAEAETSQTTTKPTTKATPKTGDSSAVFVAVGVLSVACAAAFVCLNKKKAAA